jgi:abortive infection bacteriophage resistance protein
MSIFNKPALTADQQVDLLIRRGMSIADRKHARHYLTHINYYRLRIQENLDSASASI